jgi:hypothetical protein
MDRTKPTVTMALRIPYPHGHPRELLQRLPKGVHLTPEALTLEDGSAFEFGALPPDDQFAHIFRTSCRRPATPEELAIVDNYQVNLTLCGPGGSLAAAHAIMKAAAVLIQAGGAGVFIDNSALAHGGQDWIAMTEDGGPDALSFAFATIVGGKVDIYTMGMHVLGLRDIVMRREDVERHDFDIVDVIRYLAASEKPVDDGHIIADLDGPRFKAVAEPSEVDDDHPDSPIFNPFGRLRLVSFREIAESN